MICSRPYCGLSKEGLEELWVSCPHVQALLFPLFPPQSQQAIVMVPCCWSSPDSEMMQCWPKEEPGTRMVVSRIRLLLVSRGVGPLQWRKASGQVGFGFVIEQLVRGNRVLRHVEMFPGSGESLGKNLKLLPPKKPHQCWFYVTLSMFFGRVRV